MARPSGSRSRSRSHSRGRPASKKQTPSSRPKSPKTPVKKTPSAKSPARTPAKTPSKSPARKVSSASTTSSSSSGKPRGRPLGSGKLTASTPKPAVTPKPRGRSASASSASRSRSGARAPAPTPAAAAERSVLRARQHAVSATPRPLSPRAARNGNGEGFGCRYNTAICNFAKESWGGFKDGATFITRRQLTRRDKERRNRVWKVIFFLAFAAFLYYTYMHKFVYYRQAYSYAQGYMDAARDFVNKKTK